MDSKKKKKSGYKRYLMTFWLLFVLLWVGIFGFFASVYFGALGELPKLEEVENIKFKLATEIISSDGKVLGKYYSQNRKIVEYDELPKHLVDALIATEDERFLDHSGIDKRGTARAIAYLGKKGGASTISQQLAKNLFNDTKRKSFLERIQEKPREWVVATKLERTYSKEEIIALYFNTYDFLYQAIGIASAAKVYFNKEVKDLKIEEGAVLVAMAKNPTSYNPKRNPKDSKKRRNQVLFQMKKNNLLLQSEYDSLKELPLEINFTRTTSHKSGLATYYREYLRSEVKKILKNVEEKTGKSYNIYNDGLKIYTTIDTRFQEKAEKAMKEHLTDLQKTFFKTQEKNKTAPFYGIKEDKIERIIHRSMKNTPRFRTLKDLGLKNQQIIDTFNKPIPMRIFSWEGEKDTIMSPMDSIRYYKHYLQTGVLSVDPTTGYVKAWVGGIDYKHFQYDHVQKGKRQVGSTFKPFVYATAIDQLGYSPCTKKSRAKIKAQWSPANADGKYDGELTLTDALANSVNTVTARLMYETGIRPVKNLARKLGITSDIPEDITICLGTPDISLYEMIGAYSTFANKGMFIKPISILKIEDNNGNLIYRTTPETRQVFSEEVSHVMLRLMQGVIQNGTGRRISYKYGIHTDIAGKTGTTQKNSDGWFMGVVPQLVTGVWVGCEDRDAHFRRTYYGQGANMALPIWALYMKDVYADSRLGVKHQKFKEPKNLSVELDCKKYERQTTIDSTYTGVNFDDEEF